MPKWEVRVTETRQWTVIVDAEDWLEATRVAVNEVDLTLPPERRELDPDVRWQLGEPWVHCAYYSGPWYDLHGPGDVIVLNPSYGNVFTDADVHLLQQRLEQVGLEVVDSWNGTGCDTVSFQCSGRDGIKNMTPEHRAILLAPRE
jgi:hypothetical protein